MEGGAISSRLQAELEAVAGASAERIGSPLRGVAVLARAHGDLDPGAADALGLRRHRSAARRLAAVAAEAAAVVHGAFGDRPDLERARSRVHAALRNLALQPGPSCGRALGEVARLALALPPIPAEDDWQLSAIAFADEGALRELYDGCLALAAVAVREAAGS